MAALQSRAGNAAVGSLIGGSPGLPPVVVQRMVRPARTATLGRWEHEVEWNGPEWGAWDDRGGGTSVRVTLGPGSRAPSRIYGGSPPRPDQCTVVDALNARDGGGWVRGHLWNDHLGGPGTSRNLTPMTSATNRRFNRDFEEPLKKMLWACMRHAQDNPAADHWYGVRFHVEVVEETGRRSGDANDLDHYVFEEFDHEARYVRKDKRTRAIAPAGAPLPAGFPPELL
ncbi:hypothetical protein I5Q34_08875 [Streptomyces sp. AV19]|uniref:hypothetical protein n=1 Tax=Streptomyces sp. AV19 TaxID=2793068 RepID=UPI0018FE0FC1|nr:hypothetical protein [Streptomyces sp. AV19]MBH1934399.1 hypothetical protein [Streptomyces sp. AV19]MDG4536253.1 DNA/RNA non-specific endonuclease [Streptomyces sp. AV19]